MNLFNQVIVINKQHVTSDIIMHSYANKLNFNFYKVSVNQ